MELDDVGIIARVTPEDKVRLVKLLQQEGRIVANASVVQYNEITPDNADSFHFHGDPAAFPVDAVVAVPRDRKSGVMLRGRYAEADETVQMVVPREVVDDLVDFSDFLPTLADLAGAPRPAGGSARTCGEGP